MLGGEGHRQELVKLMEWKREGRETRAELHSNTLGVGSHQYAYCPPPCVAPTPGQTREGSACLLFLTRHAPPPCRTESKQGAPTRQAAPPASAFTPAFPPQVWLWPPCAQVAAPVPCPPGHRAEPETWRALRPQLLPRQSCPSVSVSC